MDIKKLEKNWNKFGQTDPFWSILTTGGKEHSNYWQKDEFFKSGVVQIEEVMRQVQLLEINIEFKKALDFGCGIGRLTQALLKYFDEVTGVDIAASMIELAEKYNQYEKRCKYFLNTTSDLSLFPDDEFDFIYSYITLQHMKNEYSRGYLKEFLRILKPKGLIIFQCTSKENKLPFSRLIKKSLAPLKRKILNKPIMEMYGFEKSALIKFLEDNGAKILLVNQDLSAGQEWVSFHYYVIKA
jgi:ubiquinone/menaquinone biosynthesis C-methylase UbiE